MTKRILMCCGCALVAAAAAVPAQGALITFTGGNVVLMDTSVVTTNNSVTHANVDYYEEAGFRLDFVTNPAWGFVGNYYGASNDVIHAHWLAGGLGAVTAVEITKIGGGTFDLNYFNLTSNTAIGGGPAQGTEQAFVQGYVGVNPTGAAILLPSENWGFPVTQVVLGSEYNAVDRVVFFVTSDVDCFGMDDFYIDQIPTPGGVGLLAVGGLVVGTRRHRA